MRDANLEKLLLSLGNGMVLLSSGNKVKSFDSSQSHHAQHHTQLLLFLQNGLIFQFFLGVYGSFYLLISFCTCFIPSPTVAVSLLHLCVFFCPFKLSLEYFTVSYRGSLFCGRGWENRIL